MNKKKIRTVLIGFGKIGQMYANDPIMARRVPFATHAQVLSKHSNFLWEAVVDHSELALKEARNKWKIPIVAHSANEMAKLYQPELAVIATPPGSRLEIIRQFPSLRAILIEKPLGCTVSESSEIIDYCRNRGIKIQVNILRRANKIFRSFASGELKKKIGRVQAAFGIYGNGLHNNGTHMIDLVRMLLGEIRAVQAIGGVVPYSAGPIIDDINVPFSLCLSNDIVVMMQPIRYEFYRENCLDIWGEEARLSIMQEGLGIYLYPKCANRTAQGEREIASDKPQNLNFEPALAFYDMYTNLAESLRGNSELFCPGDSALQIEKIIEAIRHSSRNDGALVKLQ